MYRGLVAGVAIVVLLTVVAGGILAQPGDSSSDVEPSFDVQEMEEIDLTTFEITVFADGDARWTIEHRQEIPFDSDERDAFEAFAETFVSEETETFENFQLRAERLTSEGRNLTDRQMAASSFQRDARYDEFNQEGVVEMSFRWEGFAEVEGDRVIVADVFAGGFAILEDQRLTVNHGDGLAFDSVSPQADRVADGGEPADSEWIRWDGPQSFDDDPIRVTFNPAGETNTDGSALNGESDAEEPADPNDSGMLVPVLVTFLILVGVGGGALWYATNRSREEAGGGEGAATASTGAPASADPTQVSEAEMLSDEDRVLKLLEENGGRMRQVSIVEETEWSKSKVSMLLSEMDEEGAISKLRVGRENIISLAGEEPEAARSPFEDEEP